MGIVSLTVDKPAQIGGLLGGVAPRKPAMVTTDNLATITAAGYLNPALKLEAQSLLPTDVMDVIYSYSQTSNSGTYGQFTVSISNGVITLASWANPGDVLLPVVSGDVAIFNGTSGQIKDSTVAFSNSSDTVASLFHGTATAGDFVTVNNANKTIQDSGAAPSAASQPFVVMSPGSVTAGHLVKFNDVNGTAADSGIVATSVSGAVTQLGNLYQTSVTFNTAQMVTAYDTPLQIVANPSASQVILVHFASVYVASTGHTAYATGTAPIIQYSSGGTNGAHGAGTIATASGLVAGDITAATSQVRNLYGLATAALTGLSGLGIYFSNATGDYTAGTGTNVTITLVYELLTATI